MGMISVQVPTSLCMQNKLIIHLCYCFVEQYVYPREPNIYMGNLYLGDEKRILFFLSLPLSSFPSSPTPLIVFVPAFLLLSLCLVLISRPRSAFCAILSHDMSLAACLELQPTVNLWITCPCSLPLS